MAPCVVFSILDRTFWLMYQGSKDQEIETEAESRAVIVYYIHLWHNRPFYKTLRGMLT